MMFTGLGLSRGLIILYLLLLLTFTACLHLDVNKIHVEEIKDRKHEYSVAHYGTLDGENTRSPIGYYPWETLYESNIELRIENVGDVNVINPHLFKGRNNFRTLEEIVSNVIDPSMSEKEKAIALWDFSTKFRYHYATGDSEVSDPVKVFNIYGFTTCGDHADILYKMFCIAGLKSRIVYLYGHAVNEVFYDGRWNLFDGNTLSLFLLRDNSTIAGWDDLKYDRDLIKRTHTFGILNPDILARDQFYSALFMSGSEAYERIVEKYPDCKDNHSMLMVLRPGEAIVYRWDHPLFYKFHRKFVDTMIDPNSRDSRNIYNGLWIYQIDFTNSYWRNGVEKVENIEEKQGALTAEYGKIGSLIWKMSSPYVFLGGKLRAHGKGLKFSISWDCNEWQDLDENAISPFLNMIANDDFKNQNNFVLKLKKAKDPFLKYLKEKLSPGLRKLIDSYRSSKPLSKGLERNLVDELNTLIVNEYFFEKDRFKDISMPERILKLIEVTQQGPFTKERALLNLLLLQKAYPGEISEAQNFDYLFPPDGPPRYHYFIRCQLPKHSYVSRIEILNDIQLTPLSLPGVIVGENKFIYNSDNETKQHVRITHKWVERSSPAPPSLPQAPVFPTDGAAIEGTKITLKWQKPEATDNNYIVDYHFQLSDRPDMRWPLSPNFNKLISKTLGKGKVKEEYTLPFAGLLTPGKNYYWRVRAMNIWGVWSQWSQTWSFVPNGPCHPVNVRLESDSARGITTLKWDSNPVGRRPMKYRVYGSNEKGFFISDTPYKVYKSTKKNPIVDKALDLVFPSNFIAGTWQEEIDVIGPDLPYQNANKAYYRVVAVDEKGNRSGPSDYTSFPVPFIYNKPFIQACLNETISVELKTVYSIGNLTVREAHGQEYFVDFWDIDNVQSFSLLNAPPWIRIDNKKGILYGTAQTTGRYEFTLILISNSGRRVEQKFEINVTENHLSSEF